MATGDISLEPLLNQRIKGRLSGPATNRQVTINSAASVELTPTAGCKEMHIFNESGVTLRYGGSGVTTSTGGKLFNQGTMALNPTDDFSVFIIPESGGPFDLEIVEFF